jgi:S-DNA-T family DNA segregation ATPase FtsK/SpoIIIE
MSSRRRSPTPRRESSAARSIWTEALAILLMAVAVLVVLSLASYRGTDPVPLWGNWSPGARVGNLAGLVGAFSAYSLLQALGFAAWCAPAFLLLLGWKVFWRRPQRAAVQSFASLLLVISLAVCLDLLFGTHGPAATLRAGGYLGKVVADTLAGPLNRWGALVVAIALSGTSLLLLGRSTFLTALRRTYSRLVRLAAALWLGFVRHREARRKDRLRRDLTRRQQERREKTAGAPAEIELPLEPHGASPIPITTDAGELPEPKVARRTSRPPRRPIRPLPAAPPDAAQRGTDPQPQFDFIASLARYSPPPLSLLNVPENAAQVDEKELVETARIITEKCREFGVNGQVIAIQPGPVVTVFEFKPDAGVKYSRVVSLADDLCLAIEAESVRIDRVAGKSTVGVEVPNRTREVISLRELLGSERFQTAKAPLTLALGKELNGEPYYANLAKMPHLLIAGSTGSGKSVCLNTVITSLLYKASPEEVKLIMIDPKRLEMGVYENMPHLLTPLVTDTKKAANALKWATVEMERRYKQLAEVGVRSIDQYNITMRRALEKGRAEDDPGAADRAAEPPAPGASPARGGPPTILPYVVIVIDELADLMMTTGAEVEESITRLAQMARAVGIHLILSTQRPSVDIITGVIKANFPCRIAMRVSSKVDSRTILDANGAEHLLGHGDMLFIPPASSRLIRLHGPLVTEVEAARIVAYLKKQARPQYDESVTREETPGTSADGRGGDGDVDPAYHQAVRLAVQQGQISVSHIQRRLKLGYARAARLVDIMEENGIVGPADGSKPREVLVEPDFLQRLDEMRDEQA